MARLKIESAWVENNFNPSRGAMPASCKVAVRSVRRPPRRRFRSGCPMPRTNQISVGLVFWRNCFKEGV